MILRDQLKLKIQRAVTIALLSVGIIPAVNAEVTDASVNNPTGTTITNGSTNFAVDLDSGGPYTVINAGTISTFKDDNRISGIEIDSVVLTTLTNTSVISAVGIGARRDTRGVNLRGANANASIGTLTNSGTISGSAGDDRGYGVYLYGQSKSSAITTLTNSGTISGTAGDNNGYGVYLYGQHQSSAITTLTNSGTISGTTRNSNAYGVYLYGYYNSSTITTLTNSGTISGTAGNAGGYGVYLYSYYGSSTLTTLTNSGTISGTTYDIYNDGTTTIVNFNNQQGKSGNDVLAYDGKLPTNYNVIVASTSDYGQASFTHESGTTNFGVSSSSSFSGAATYASVISGLATGKIGATRSGTVGGYSWSLVLQSGQSEIWDLVITSSRTGYSSRILTGKRSNIAAILEAINTAGSNSTLTSALDGLSDASLDKALNQIEGVTIKKMSGQSFQKHSTFKRAVSSALSAPSVNSLTKNNYASLSSNDLSLQKDQGGYQVHSFNDFDFKSMANIFKNKDLFSLKSKGSTFFIRTFADQSNQDVVNGDAGYEASTAGFLAGNQNNLSDEIQQGWALGLSTNDTDFDDNFGNSDSKTLHAMIYQNQQYDNFNLGLNIGTYATRTVMDRKVTEGVSQTLNSKTYNYGFDITADIKQSYQLENNFTFTPSFSTNISYILQDDLDESGGDLALSVINDNLLIVKPEIGFALDKNFKNTETVSQNFGFSVYGSYEDKLEGTTSKAKIKDTGSNFNIVDDNTDDTFITAGLGYSLLDKIENVEYNLGVYHTQNDDNDLNSTLLSLNYSKKF